jgi:hypothetical protein
VGKSFDKESAERQRNGAAISRFSLAPTVYRTFCRLLLPYGINGPHGNAKRLTKGPSAFSEREQARHQ